MRRSILYASSFGLIIIALFALAAPAAATLEDDLVIYSWQYDGFFRDGTEENIAIHTPGGGLGAFKDELKLGSHFGGVDAVLGVSGNATGFTFDARAESPFFSPPYVGGRTTLDVIHFFRKEPGQASLRYKVTYAALRNGEPSVAGPGPRKIKALAAYQVTLAKECGGGGYCPIEPVYSGQAELRGNSHVWKASNTNRQLKWGCLSCASRTPQYLMATPTSIDVDLSPIGDGETFIASYRVVTLAFDPRQDIDGGSYAEAYFRDPLDPDGSQVQISTSGLTQLPVPPSATLVRSAALLLETGQGVCFDDDGRARACAGTGEDGDSRAGARWPEPRFVAGSGAEADCMLDRATGLLWPKDSAGAAEDWSAALAQAEAFSRCGHDDWRLPNVNELESLVNAGVGDQAAWLSSVGITGLDAAPLWTSTSAAGAPLSAWTVDLADGAVVDAAKTTLLRILPVRG